MTAAGVRWPGLITTSHVNGTVGQESELMSEIGFDGSASQRRATE